MTQPLSSPETPAADTPMESVLALVEDDMAAVNACIRRRLRSHVVLVNHVGEHIVRSGGKRLRPMLVLLSARACGYEGDSHIELAAVIELIHTATLLHDDVVDDADRRRGRRSANALWGNPASVLVGDFLYSRSFQMMVDVDDFEVMRIMADATNTIAEGEVLQLINLHDADTTEERYLEVVRNKTAKLFEAGASLGAVLAGRGEPLTGALARYGMLLGTAFQIADDVLDYDAAPEELGKDLGNDLAEGKPTLPLIYAANHGDEAQTQLVRSAIETGGLGRLAEVQQALRDSGALSYAAERARATASEANEALAAVPESRYKDALAALTRYAIDRAR